MISLQLACDHLVVIKKSVCVWVCVGHWARRGLFMAPVSYLAGGESLSHIHPSLLNLMRNGLFHAMGTSRTSRDPFIERDLWLSFSNISLLTVMDIRLKAVLGY